MQPAKSISSPEQLSIPGLRGRVRAGAELSGTNWFQVGGRAEYLFKPEDTEDLAHFMRYKPHAMPVTVIGVGSNLIVRDGGIEGVVIRLGRGFTRMEAHGDSLAAGAACLDVHVAEFACSHAIAGLEFLSGIPGTLGGAVAMNAGAYGSDMAQVLLSAEIVDENGAIRTLSRKELGFSYRASALPAGAIVTKAVLRGIPGEQAVIAARMREIQAAREETQPIRSRTGGSTFKNPPGRKAWELIDKADCRGLALGGAMVSQKHCNFLINTGNATAADLENLGEEVRRRVKAATGVELEWEIKRMGKEQ